jgi:uncharacterized membrane protein
VNRFSDRGPEHALERLIFFSDAVFAIAITLLVIEIHVPTVHAGAPAGDYWEALAHLIPNFIGFIVSFFVIGAFWAGHHRAFDCARHWDPRLSFLNLQLLFTIAAMPFFTAFMSRNNAAVVPAALYCGWLFVTALASMRLQRVLVAPPVVGEHVSVELGAGIRRRGAAVALGAATALLVALISPLLSQVALISIWPWRVLLDRLHVFEPKRAAASA